MDLDAIKNKWQNQQIKSSLNDDVVEKMLNKKGGTALDKLKVVEKLFFILNTLCILVVPLLLIVGFSLFFIIGFGVLCVTSSVWSYYKMSMLRQINIITMNLLDVYSQVVKYRKLIIYELILGVCLIFLFDMWYIADIAHQHDEAFFSSNFYILQFIILYVITLVICALLYYKLYWKNIKKLLKAIDEITSFTNEKNEVTETI